MREAVELIERAQKDEAAAVELCKVALVGWENIPAARSFDPLVLPDICSPVELAEIVLGIMQAQYPSRADEKKSG